MAFAERTEVFDLSAEKFYKVIIDYASYPKFVEGVSSIEVLEQTETGARVEYCLNLIKKFQYSCKMTHEKNKSVSWKLESGDLFKLNEGSWTIKELAPNKIEVTYKVNVDFKGLVPKMVINKLVSHNLPNVIKSYADQAKISK